MVRRSENGDLGGLWLERRGLPDGSEVLDIFSRVRRAAPSLQMQSVEPVEASYVLAKTATLTMLWRQGSPLAAAARRTRRRTRRPPLGPPARAPAPASAPSPAVVRSERRGRSDACVWRNVVCRDRAGRGWTIMGRVEGVARGGGGVVVKRGYEGWWWISTFAASGTTCSFISVASATCGSWRTCLVVWSSSLTLALAKSGLAHVKARWTVASRKCGKSSSPSDLDIAPRKTASHLSPLFRRGGTRV